MPWGCLRFVIVAFSDQTHLLILISTEKEHKEICSKHKLPVDKKCRLLKKIETSQGEIGMDTQQSISVSQQVRNGLEPNAEVFQPGPSSGVNLMPSSVKALFSEIIKSKESLNDTINLLFINYGKQTCHTVPDIGSEFDII